MLPKLFIISSPQMAMTFVLTVSLCKVRPMSAHGLHYQQDVEWILGPWSLKMYRFIWRFPKIWVPHFSRIFLYSTIHFGVPPFMETPIYGNPHLDPPAKPSQIACLSTQCKTYKLKKWTSLVKDKQANGFVCNRGTQNHQD